MMSENNVSLKEEANKLMVQMDDSTAETLISRMAKNSLFIGLLEGYVCYDNLVSVLFDNVRYIMSDDTYYERILLDVDYEEDFEEDEEECMNSKTFLSELRDSILELVDCRFHCADGLFALYDAISYKLGYERSESIYSEAFYDVLMELSIKEIKVWGIGSVNGDYEFYSACLDDEELIDKFASSYCSAGEV
jgi:hypothetical protein